MAGAETKPLLLSMVIEGGHVRIFDAAGHLLLSAQLDDESDGLEQILDQLRKDRQCPLQ